MKTSDLHKRLEIIFQEHTTTHWKNGWQHEGDRLSEDLTIQKEVSWNNLFLLENGIGGLSLSGPMGFKIEVTNRGGVIRVDIRGQVSNIGTHYLVDNESDWLAHCDFIVDLCQKIYNGHVMIRDSIKDVPKDLHGEVNPKFAYPLRRDRQIDDIIGDPIDSQISQ